MTDLDNLRPEVRRANSFLDSMACSEDERAAVHTIRAELLRLVGDLNAACLSRDTFEAKYQCMRDRAERAGAELAALKARTQWQPIETAPKDGNRVLLWHEEWAAPFAGQFYGAAAGGWRLDYRVAPFTYQPTHWMPLPEPPAERGEG